MNTRRIPRAREEIALGAASCLARAAGQHGVLQLPVQIGNPPGPPAPCNAATLFELHWRIDSAGRIRLQASVDGLVFQEVFT